MNRIFSVVAVLAVGLSILSMGMGPAVAQETATNSTATAAATETANRTATTTTTATAAPTSSPTATATPYPTITPTPRPTAGDVIEDVDPRNATAEDVREISGWLRSEGEDRSEERVERAREWLSEAADERGITLPGLGIDGSPNETATPDATGETSTPEPERNSTQLPGEPIDEKTSLANWHFSDGMFTLTFEYLGEQPRTVTLTESTQGEEGTQRFATTEERLLPGTNTVTMSTMIKGGESAVSITTTQSFEQGYGISVSTGQQGNDPFASYGGTSGVLSGIGISILLSGGAAGWVLWREESGVIEA